MKGQASPALNAAWAVHLCFTSSPAGECTIQPGVLAWYEIKRKLGGTTPSIDPVKMAAYATYDAGQHWVGFDNQETLR